MHPRDGFELFGDSLGHGVMVEAGCGDGRAQGQKRVEVLAGGRAVGGRKGAAKSSEARFPWLIVCGAKLVLGCVTGERPRGAVVGISVTCFVPRLNPIRVGGVVVATLDELPLHLRELERLAGVSSHCVEPPSWEVPAEWIHRDLEDESRLGRVPPFGRTLWLGARRSATRYGEREGGIMFVWWARGGAEYPEEPGC